MLLLLLPRKKPRLKSKVEDENVRSEPPWTAPAACCGRTHSLGMAARTAAGTLLQQHSARAVHPERVESDNNRIHTSLCVRHLCVFSSARQQAPLSSTSCDAPGAGVFVGLTGCGTHREYALPRREHSGSTTAQGVGKRVDSAVVRKGYRGDGMGVGPASPKTSNTCTALQHLYADGCGSGH